MAPDTYNDIRTEVYTYFGENETSGVPLYNLDITVKPMINEVQFLVCNLSVVNEIDPNHPTISCGDYRPLYREKFIQNVQPQKLTTATTIGGTTVEFDCTGFADEGYICLNGNVISYTGNTGTELTGCTGIELVHPLTSIIYQVFPVEVDSDVSLDMWYLNTGVLMEYIDFRKQPDLPEYYTLISDNLPDSQRRYVQIFGYDSNFDQFKLTYYAKVEDMVEADDPCMLPDHWGKLVIAPIVAGMIIRRDGIDMVKGNSVLMGGYAALQNFYQKMSRVKKKYAQQFKTRAMSNYYGNDSFNTPNTFNRAS